MKRNREDILAAAFAAAGSGAVFDPIQLQVLLFLIDRSVPNSICGPTSISSPDPSALPMTPSIGRSGRWPQGAMRHRPVWANHPL